jgi:hypothetical protein
MKNLLAADFEHGISSLAWWLVGGRRGAAEGGRRGARLWIGATACEATQEGGEAARSIGRVPPTGMEPVGFWCLEPDPPKKLRPVGL